MHGLTGCGDGQGQHAHALATARRRRVLVSLLSEANKGVQLRKLLEKCRKKLLRGVLCANTWFALHGVLQVDVEKRPRVAADSEGAPDARQVILQRPKVPEPGVVGQHQVAPDPRELGEIDGG